MRSGSSEKEISGSSGVRKKTLGQIGQTAEGIDGLEVRKSQGDGIDA